MSEDNTGAAIKEKLTELQEQLDSVHASEKPGINLPPPPELPADHDLDQFESLLVDAILWREDAAQTKVKFAKTELESCKMMRQNLMTKLVARLKINLDSHSVTINQDTRRATIIKR